MTALKTTSLLLVVCSAASAQAVTSPAGYLYKEGNSQSDFNLGAYREGRFQYADGTHRGMAMTIKGTAYRHGNYNYGAAHAPGRSWSNVKLTISDCEVAKMTTNFATNQMSTPTVVFDGPVQWATQLGKPGKFPADWKMSFPFKTNWSYTGDKDICLDYQFAGGTLANGSAWTATGSVPYYMDSQDYPTYITENSIRLGEYGNGKGCNDRTGTSVYGAELWTQATVYGSDYSNANLRDTIGFTQNGRYFPATRPCMTVIGFRSIRNGFPFPGIHCNKVYVDLSIPFFLVPSFTNANGTLVTMNLGGPNPGTGVVDEEVVSQVVWADGVTQQTLLSNAAQMYLPNKPPSQPTTLLYYHNTSNATGYLRSNRTYQPVVRYTR